MVRLRHVTIAFAMVILVATALGSTPVYKHSGSVLAVDRAAGTILLGEVGPWKVVNGETVVTEQRIAVTDRTEFVMVQRSGDDFADFPGGFVEAPLVAWDIVPGDYVTVECEHRGARMVALKVTIMSFRS